MNKATFLKRPNRFTLVCRLRGKVVRAYLPNPGRMWELLLPGATVYLERAPSAREKISIIPLAVELRADLSLTSRVRILDVPWDIVEKEARDSGSYIVILRLREDSTVPIGGLGEIRFRKGYYLYVGSARKNLSSRLERHRRMRKRLFWHVDFLRAVAEFHFAVPVRTQDILECAIARAVSEIAQWEIPGFGSSDCLCPSHLYGMAKDPLQSSAVISLLQYYRMDRLK
jgi:sugar fermentation stimulation protein A